MAPAPDLTRRRARSVWRALARLGLLLILAAALLYAARAPLLTVVGRQLVHVDPDRPADVLVVLAGRTPDRELSAVDLFHAGLAPRIVITTEIERPQWDALRARGVPVEATIDFRRRIFTRLGVPETALDVLPQPVVSTVAESKAVAEWVRLHPVRSAIVVTSPSHTARARIVFQSALAPLGVDVRMHAAEAGTFRPDTWWHDRENLTEGVTEWQKWLLYQLRFYRNR